LCIFKIGRPGKKPGHGVPLVLLNAFDKTSLLILAYVLTAQKVLDQIHFNPGLQWILTNP